MEFPVDHRITGKWVISRKPCFLSSRVQEKNELANDMTYESDRFMRSRRINNNIEYKNAISFASYLVLSYAGDACFKCVTTGNGVFLS